jgi:Ca2+-binding EF-hand superfamily protein
MGVCVATENENDTIYKKKARESKLGVKMTILDEARMKEHICECFNRFDKDGDGVLNF